VPTPRVVLPVLVGLALLVSSPASAQQPVDAKRTAWQEQLQEATKQAAALAGATTEDQVALRKGWEQRRDLLRDLLRADDALRLIGDPSTLRQRAARRGKEREELEASAPAPVGPVSSAGDLAPYEERRKAAEAALSAAKAALESVQRLGGAAEPERTPLPVRRKAIEEELDRLRGVDDPAAQLRRGTLGIEQALLDLRERLEGIGSDRLPEAVALAQADLDLAQIRFNRADDAFKAAQAKLKEAQSREAERLRGEAADLERQAQAESDPVQRYRLRTRAESRRATAGRLDAEARLAELSQRRTVGAGSLERVQNDRNRLAARVKLTEGVSDHVASLLITTIVRTMKVRRALETQVLPRILAELETNRDALMAVQDRLWDLEAPDDENPVLQTLLEEAGAQRADEARRAFREETGGGDGLIQAVRAETASLGSVDTELNALEEQTRDRIKANEQLYGFAQSAVYWVRSAEPISLSVLASAAGELRTIPATLTAKRALGGAGMAFRRSPVGFALIGLLFLASLVVAWRLVPLLHRVESRLGENRGKVVKIAVASAMAVLLSMPVPLVLLLSGYLLGLLGLPSTYETPGKVVLLGLALFWFVRGIASRLLRPEGVGVAQLRLDPDLVRQIRRSVRIVIGGALIFRLPNFVLAGEPFLFTVMPRLLYTAYLLSVAIALVLMLHRDGALLHTWTRGQGPLYRLWGLLGPLLSLGLLGLVAMDAFGYRVGARVLMLNVALTVVAALAIRACYALTRQMVEGITRRVHRRTAAAEGARAAWEASSTVMQQLTRLVSTAILALAVVLLADFWGIDAAVSSSLRSVTLVTIDASTSLTLWEVFKALIWIVATHFVLRNLAGLYEVLLFPIVGESAANRYVLLAISRYVLLVVGYAAALLTLRFPFSSLGWIVAAASVGLGFGLQEIVANFISGLILLLERPVRVGDIISVGDTGGMVEKIMIRATVVTNWDLQEIVIPNKDFITSNVVNWTLNHNLMRRKVQVGVSYGSDVEQVLRVLREEVDRHPKVVKEPPPRVLFEGFGNSSLDFEIWAFAPIQEGKAAMSELRTAIHRRFREEGIEIPFPQRDLHLRTVDGEAARGLRGLPPGPEPEAGAADPGEDPA